MKRFTLIPAAILAACSGSGGTSAPIQPSLAIVTGANQSDTVGKTLPAQLGAKLTDAHSGKPLTGRILNWAVVDGGGSLSAAVTQTGSDGIGRNSWTLGPTVGTQIVEARYIDPDTGTPVTDTARATALYGGAAQIWANDQPSPHPAGIGWTALPVNRGQTITLYYGFIDQHGNVGAVACGPVNWSFGGNGGFGNDTIVLVGAPVLLASRAFSQDFKLTGPDTSLMNFDVTSCVPGTTGYIWAPPSVPVNYQP